MEAALPPIPLTRATPDVPRISDIDLCAWVAQAAPGEVLEYHRGFLALDRLTGLSDLGDREAERIGKLADRAFHAAEQRLVHLVQQRLGPDRFSYRAIARPKPRDASAVLSALLLAEAA